MVLECVSPFMGLFGELQRRQLPLSEVDQVGLFANRASPEPEDAPASSSCSLSVQNPAIPPSQSSNLEVLWDCKD